MKSISNINITYKYFIICTSVPLRNSSVYGRSWSAMFVLGIWWLPPVPLSLPGRCTKLWWTYGQWSCIEESSGKDWWMRIWREMVWSKMVGCERVWQEWEMIQRRCEMVVVETTLYIFIVPFEIWWLLFLRELVWSWGDWGRKSIFIPWGVCHY